MAYLYNIYSAPINIRQSAASIAGTTVWSMRNNTSSTKVIFIESLQINMAFDVATPITRQLLRYDFVRFSAATPTGGTTVTVVSDDSTAPSTQITDVRFLDTGLTTTGVTFGTANLTVGVPATDSAVVNYQTSNIPIFLAAGEGICLRLNVASLAGQSMTGFISWSER